jgi:hypothetical protein
MRFLYVLFLSAPVFILATGCDDSKPTASSGAKSATVNTPPPATVDAHVHPTEGPHHGDLIELGNEEYHAEMVHDDASVTIYILDSAAKVAVPITATELVINLMHDGKPEQFKLAAVPDTADPAGKSSRFTLKDAELAKHIEEETAEPKLTVTINNKPYKGDIKHEHGGDHGHDH